MEKILVETSVKHVHVSQEDLEKLFGKGYELTPRKSLSQPGQFACEERVIIEGPKGQLKGLSILGPVRSATQVELAITDCRAVGISAPIRESGDIEGTPGCKIIGPAGEVEIDKGVIVAKRHIHMTPEDAAAFGVTDKEVVSVKIDSPERSTIYGDTVVRVSPRFSLAMHLDTDEGNAELGGTQGELNKKLLKL